MEGRNSRPASSWTFQRKNRPSYAKVWEGQRISSPEKVIIFGAE